MIVKWLFGSMWSYLSEAALQRYTSGRGCQLIFWLTTEAPAKIKSWTATVAFLSSMILLKMVPIREEVSQWSREGLAQLQWSPPMVSIISHICIWLHTLCWQSPSRRGGCWEKVEKYVFLPLLLHHQVPSSGQDGEDGRGGSQSVYVKSITCFTLGLECLCHI